MGHCETHDDIKGAIDIANSNQEWFQKIGKVIVGLLSTILVLVIPALITFFVYIARIETRVSLMEQSLKSHIEQGRGR